MSSRFVVRRLNWRPAGEYFIRLPGEVRLGAFDTFDAADGDRRTREAEVRARVNPFKCGTAWHALTALPEAVFRDWVRDTGLEPPPAGAPTDWLAWWDGTQDARTAEQTERVWDGLTRVRFFDVLERPAGEVAFAVVRVMWEYNDAWYEPGAEGGRTVKAFRSRERADAECARLEAEGRRQWYDRCRIEAGRWELADWPALGDRSGVDSEKAFGRIGVRLYEVVEIDLREGAT